MLSDVSYDKSNLEIRVLACATPLDLLILTHELLIDELLIFRSAVIDKKNDKGRLSAKLQDIVQRSLIETLSFQENRKIAQSLRGVYDWSLRQIVIAGALREIDRIDAVIDSYRVLLSAWREIKNRN